MLGVTGTSFLLTCKKSGASGLITSSVCLVAFKPPLPSGATRTVSFLPALPLVSLRMKPFGLEVGWLSMPNLFF